MSKLIRWFRPPQKLYRLPDHITARYAKGDISKAQAIIMMSGKARDPQQAQRILDELRAKHGNQIWEYVEYHLLQPRTQTFSERLHRLFQRMFGESKHYTYTRNREPVVPSQYVFLADTDETTDIKQYRNTDELNP